MDKKVTLQQNEPSWGKFLTKNLKNNKQLDFSRNMFISCVSEDSTPDTDMLKLRDFNTSTGALIFCFDRRSDFASSILQAKKACVTVYFPLSKEKMKFLGEIRLVDKNSKSEEDQALLLNLWNTKMHSQEHKQFKEAKPDIQVVKADDLNTYNNPDVGSVAQNCILLEVNPFKGKLTLIRIKKSSFGANFSSNEN